LFHPSRAGNVQAAAELCFKHDLFQALVEIADSLLKMKVFEDSENQHAASSVSSNEELLKRCAAWFAEKGRFDHAVLCDARGGNFSVRGFPTEHVERLPDCAYLSCLTGRLLPRTVTTTVPLDYGRLSTYSPILDIRMARPTDTFFVRNQDALKLAVLNDVPVTETLAETLLSGASGPSVPPEKKKQLTLDIAKLCKRQGAYQLSAKLYATAGERNKGTSLRFPNPG
jgi:hypothetical protein